MIKKIFIITTEASADTLGARLLSTFEKNKNIKFYGVGGEHLSKCINFTKLFDIKLFSIMGFIEVLKNIRAIKKNINNIKLSILNIKPDMVLTIDGSSLAKHIVKWIKSNKNPQINKIKCIHYVAPQVWAWGEKRAKIFAKIFDKILCFFDFETKYFLKYNCNIKCPVVGYAHLEGISGNSQDFLKKYPIAEGKQIITILPGSRKNEVQNIMSTYKEVIRKIYKSNNNSIFFLPTVNFLKEYVTNIINSWDISYRPHLISSDTDKYNLFSSTYLAISTSGTVVSELSFFNVPTIVNYKFNYLTALLAKIFVKIKFASLINILNNKMIQIELLQDKANTTDILNCALEILQNPNKHNAMKEGIKKGMTKFMLKDKLTPSKKAYSEIMNLFD